MESNINVIKEPSPFAGFWVRFAAYLIDGVVFNLLILILFFCVGIVLTIAGGRELAMSFSSYLKDNFLVNYGLCFLIILAYFAVMESSSMQCTLGKRCFGIITIDAETGKRISFLKAFGRAGLKIFLSILLPSVAFSKYKTGFHDDIIGTMVVRKKYVNKAIEIIQHEQEENKTIQKEHQEAAPEMHKKIKEDPDRWDKYYYPLSKDGIDDEIYSRERKAYWDARLG